MIKIRKQINALIEQFLELTQGERFFELDETISGRGYVQLKYSVNISPYQSLKTFEKEYPENNTKKLLDFLSNSKEILVLDIETSGLSRDVPIFMAGVLKDDGKTIEAYQFVARTINKEKKLLKWLKGFFNEHKVITYNGNSFDLPFVRERCAFHGLEFVPPELHLDLLPFARKVWRDSFNSRKLTVLEHNILDLRREFDIPSAWLPYLIELYLKTADERYLKLIARHNLYDLLTTHSLLKELEKFITNL